MNRYQVSLRCAVAAWAVLAAAVLACTPKQSREETYSPPLPETHAEAVETPAAVPEVKEPDKPLQDKLPMIENATLTHYCICERCCGKPPEHPAYGITASGRPAEPYVSVAVDPYVIELGSTVYVDYGDGEIHEYRADDTGSGVAGAHIDLCVEDHEEALELGEKTVKVWWSEWQEKE